MDESPLLCVMDRGGRLPAPAFAGDPGSGSRRLERVGPYLDLMASSKAKNGPDFCAYFAAARPDPRCHGARSSRHGILLRARPTKSRLTGPGPATIKRAREGVVGLPAIHHPFNMLKLSTATSIRR